MSATIEARNTELSTELLDVRQVAERLHVSERTVWRLSKMGILHPVRIGRRIVRWRRDDITCYIDSLGR